MTEEATWGKHLRQSIQLVLVVSLIFLVHMPLMAQFDEEEGEATATKAAESSNTEGDVEALYDRFDQDQEKRRKEKQEQKQRQAPNVSTLSDLAHLAPFEDIAVIQRRFLPKTNRFEISTSGVVTLNNPFFNNLGLALRGAYYFREKYGVELMYFFLSSAERTVTQDLQEKRRIQTENLVTPKNFMGAAFKWNPIYGKITFLNRRIVPYDLNFNLGFGLTETDDNSGEPTLHIGSSQIFAISKSMAFRWDFTWNFYQANTKKSTGESEKLNQNDLYLGLGMSFYFPEATYR